MTINQIRCFETVCQTMSFSKAANTLYISQPAISKSISKLEQELGAELFRQSSNSLYLTAAGELFLSFTKTIHKEYNSFVEALDQLKTYEDKTVRLGCPETWNPIYFSKKLEDCFYSVNPDGKLIIEARRLSDLLIGLQNGSLDMIISHDFYTPSIPSLDSRYLTSTYIGILYAKAYFDPPVTLEKLTETDFVLYDQDIEKRFSAVIQSVCARHGFSVHVSNRGQITRALFDVARGSGIMLFTDWDSAIGNTAFGFYSLDDTLPVKLVYTPERLSIYATRFLDSSADILWD